MEPIQVYGTQIMYEEIHYQYCEKCGTQNEIKWKRDRKKYDPTTGKKHREWLIECPNKKWWFDGHFSIVRNDEPSWY